MGDSSQKPGRWEVSVLCAILLVAACAWLTRSRPWQRQAPAPVAAVADDVSNP